MENDILKVLTDAWAKSLLFAQAVLNESLQAFNKLSMWLVPQVEYLLISLGWGGEMERRAILAVLSAAGALLVFLMMLFWVRRGKKKGGGVELARLTRRPRIVAYGAAGLLVLVFGGWSMLAPLASASIAPGVISPDGNRKTIAHLEGGIIRNIHVHEGDPVTKGQPLLTLEDVQARAFVGEMQERYQHLLAIEARLLTQRSGVAEITFPDALLNTESVSAISAMVAQQNLLTSQRATQAGRERILHQRMLQLDEQNTGLEGVTEAQLRQLLLLREEISGLQELFDKGLTTADRLLALRRAEAALDAEQASNRAKIAENAQRKGEAETQLLTMREQVVENANDELAGIQRQAAEIRSQLPSRKDILDRTVIRAPIDGIVMNIRATTETGVIRSGEPILEIVPREAQLIIDARVTPNDIDRVRPGMEARIVLSAYRQRSLPLIHGVLRSVSADRLIEDRTGEPYFLAKVEVNAGDLDGVEDVRLLPGMFAEVMILNSEQPLWRYLLDPLFQSFNRSFRDS